MAYSDLSLKERARVIHEGVKAGLKSLKDIQSFYDSRVSRDNDYDMEAYYKEHPEHIFNHEGHYPDTYKLPNHPTFSDESVYSTPQTPGGHWDEENKTFEPSDYMIDKYGSTPTVDRLRRDDPDYTPVYKGGVLLPEVEVKGHKFEEGGTNSNSVVNTIRRRLANNINPFRYSYPLLRTFGAVVLNRKENDRKNYDGSNSKYMGRLAAWSKYLGTPVDEIPDLEKYITESKYKPSQASNPNSVYYTYRPQEGQSIMDAYRAASGNFTLGIGEDENGKYISLYDMWDLNPLDARSNSGDASMGIGTPFEAYDRIYESENPEDYYEAEMDYRGALLLNDGRKYGDNVVSFKDGGSIHIAPSKRGTFTAAATKHGKSVQAFASQVLAHKENYSPAMVKKANFARNSAHWHEDGGDENKPRRVNFTSYMADPTYGGNRNRPMNIAAMEQLQDSLIDRGFGEAQRLAILATAAQEMDARGAASVGVGGNGYLGLSPTRMSPDLLDDSPEGRGKQIHYILEDLTHVYTGTNPQAGNWNDGGSGGPKIMNGQDGYNQFWNATSPGAATRILNKSYIRPAGRLDAWNNRAGVAEGMQRHMRSTGGPMYPYSFSKKQMPAVRFDDGGEIPNPNLEGINIESPTASTEAKAEVGSGPVPTSTIQPSEYEFTPAALGTRTGTFNRNLRYDYSNPNVVDFFNTDVAARYQRTNPQATEAEIAAIKAAPYTQWVPEKLGPTTGAVNYHGAGTGTYNAFNPDFFLSNPVIVHEDTHAYRQGVFGNQDFVLDENGEPMIVYGNGDEGLKGELLMATPFGHDISGYTPQEQAMLGDAYDMSLVVDGNPTTEQGTSNTELRYRIWRDWKNENGRTPSLEELDAYIDNMSDEDMLRYMEGNSGYGINGYINYDLASGQFYSDEFKDLEKEIDQVKYAYSTEKNLKTKKEIKKRLEELNKKRETIKRFNFDKVKHALKNVAMNDSKGRYNDVESLGFA